ncbi:MAG: CDP-diacylglycerol--glycerol-3-phosphate 3-phosphatidyltransferase [Alphaproteobacteria bacterium]|nr:CDP-diacylglycerol--glycerol-3-phosphate 3-phosphatidyltransferase [Alphaproteobacteria bacterium]
MATNLPNLLTFSRIVAMVLVVGLMFQEPPLGNWMALAAYTYACVTDFFDGYLARVLDQQSALGRFLDPIADKLLVSAVLFMLAATNAVTGLAIIPAIIILCREILVSGLREFLGETQISVPVSNLAKWKTTLQMVALGFLIVNDAGPDFGPLTTSQVGEYGLWIAAILTLVTGYDYLRVGMKHIMDADSRE